MTSEISRRKYALFAAITVFVSVVASLGFLEIAMHLMGFEHRYVNPLHSFHVQDPVLGYRGRADADARFAVPGRFDVRVRHDARGFRVQEHEKSGSNCARQVFVYGDSFTWGWGVDQGEGYTDLMNRDLPGVCVHNRGLNASGTVLQYTIFETEDLASANRGDVVFVMMCLNDFRDNYDQDKEVTAVIENGRVVRIPPRRAFQSPLRAFLKQNSFVYSIASSAADSVKRRLKSRSVTEKPPRYPVLSGEDPQVEVTEHFLAEFKRVCDEHELELMISLIPSTVEFGEPDYGVSLEAARSYLGHVQRIAAAHGIEYVDLLPAFLEAKAENPDAPLSIFGDGHWNAAGHRLVAEVLVAQLAAYRESPEKEAE